MKQRSADDYVPDWPPQQSTSARLPEDGWHLFSVTIMECLFENVGESKPYMNVTAEITSEPFSGVTFRFRVYLHTACEWRVRFFLGKFEYPKELLSSDPPTIRRTSVVGLSGQVMALVTSEGGAKDFDIVAFGHLSDPELERRYAKQRRQAQVEEEAVDVQQDVKDADKTREPGDEEYQASDEDLPANLWPETKPEEDEWPE